MPKPISLPALVATILALATLPATAQFKVVRPDGSVTYTDRPPSDPNARVIQLGRNGQPMGAELDLVLPPELRRAVQKYPVTLYTAADCPPCDSARQLLERRGVPFSERRIATLDDAQALERVVGTRSVPALSIGAQPVRGFSDTEWTAYLDAAGYPRESKLPANWPPTAAIPMVERAPAVAGPVAPPAPGSSAAAAAAGAAVPPEVPASAGVRF